ncbi:MAG: sirohydrochlorin cobaltochelatase [Deltaproteobacteria bacterium]|nr:sirohydrochlorin cobaltochelatase [Deltaproteobacteria bacterium]
MSGQDHESSLDIMSACDKGIEMTTERSSVLLKIGILLIAFGTRTPQALATYQFIERKIQAIFPDIPVRWAFTSAVVRKKPAGDARPVESVETSLARMMDEGFTHVAVQALHVISGKEHHDLTVNCRLFGRMAGGFREVMMGLPLLGTGDDMDKAATALISTIPRERKPEEAVIFMGHGSPHPANACYTALMYHLQQTDPNVFVGTMSGRPGIGDICESLRKQKITSAYLLPCLAVVGNHTLKDMAGENEHSWKSVLEKHGISCKPVLKGLAEYDAIVDIWVDHLKTIVGTLL